MDNKSNEGMVDPDDMEAQYLRNQLILVKTMKSGKIVFMKFLGDLNISQFEKVWFFTIFDIYLIMQIVSVFGDQYLSGNR